MKKAIIVAVAFCTIQTSHTSCDEPPQATPSTRLYYSQAHDLSFYPDPAQKKQIQVWGSFLGRIATFNGSPAEHAFDLSTLVLHIQGTRAQQQLRLDIEAACHTWAESESLSRTPKY